jgi:hypothetical protein
MRKFAYAGLILLTLSAPGQVRADNPTTLADCVNEIKVVCTDFEDNLEGCLAERSDQMSDDCRAQLKTSIALVHHASGPGACVNDIRNACPTLQGDLLLHCVMDHKATFSQSCRDYLDQSLPEPTGAATPATSP